MTGTATGWEKKPSTPPVFITNGHGPIRPLDHGADMAKQGPAFIGRQHRARDQVAHANRLRKALGGRIGEVLGVGQIVVPSVRGSTENQQAKGKNAAQRHG